MHARNLPLLLAVIAVVLALSRSLMRNDPTITPLERQANPQSVAPAPPIRPSLANPPPQSNASPRPPRVRPAPLRRR